MKQKIKVVLALGSRHTVPPVSNSSGVAWILYNIVKDLPRDKFDIHVITKWNDELKGKDIDSIYHHVNIETPVANIKKSFWKRMPYTYRKKKFTFSQPDRIVYYQGIIKKVKEIKPDLVMSIVHTELFYLLKNAYPEAKHCYWYHSSDIFGLDKRLKDFLFKNTNGILVLNELTVQSIKKNKPELDVPVKKIYNAIDTSEYHKIDERSLREEMRKRFNYSDDDIVIGYAGRFAKEKNILKLFKSVHALQKKGLPVKVLMAGDIKNEKMPDWNYYNECMDYAKKYLDNTVQFTGWLSNEKLKQFYCAIDMGVLLSQEKEGSPMFFLEASSFGKPMIATNVGSNPEHLVDGVNGFLIDVNDIENQLPEAVLKLVEDKKIYSEMSRNGREYIKKHHSWPDKVREFEKFILAVANGSE